MHFSATELFKKNPPDGGFFVYIALCINNILCYNFHKQKKGFKSMRSIKAPKGSSAQPAQPIMPGDDAARFVFIGYDSRYRDPYVLSVNTIQSKLLDEHKMEYDKDIIFERLAEFFHLNKNSKLHSDRKGWGLNPKHFAKFRKYLVSRSNRTMLTAVAIQNNYKFVKTPTIADLDQMIKGFAETYQDATGVQYVKNGKGSRFVPVIDKQYLDTFMQANGLQIRPKKETLTAEQHPIDPTMPGYKTDPSLDAVSDEKMDALAWKLAATNVESSERADEMLFAGLAKKRRQK